MEEIMRKCIADAERAVSEIKDPERKIESFKLVLAKLLDLNVGCSNERSRGNTSTSIPMNSSEQAVNDEVPVISPANGTVNNIRALFSTAWGKGRRTRSEVSGALDKNGIPDPKHVSTVLSRLVDAKELLRIKQGDSFVYWRNPANAVSMEEA